MRATNLTFSLHFHRLFAKVLLFARIFFYICYLVSEKYEAIAAAEVLNY
jgi:hypothetical protein